MPPVGHAAPATAEGSGIAGIWKLTEPIQQTAGRRAVGNLLRIDVRDRTNEMSQPLTHTGVHTKQQNPGTPARIRIWPREGRRAPEGPR